MKKLYLLLVCAIGIAEGIVAQTTVQFGTTSTTSSTYGPFFRTSASSTVYGSSKTHLLTETELAAQGIVPGVAINAIKWYKGNASVFTNGATAVCDLYVRNAGTLTSYAASINVLSYLPNFSLLSSVTYNTTTNNITGTGTWVGFTGMNYVYTGGSLEFFTTFTITPGSGSATDGSFTWGYSSTTPDYKYNYLNSVATSTSTFTRATSRSAIQMTFTNTACTTPPSAGTITSSPANPICLGTSVDLRPTSIIPGTGKTYLYQSSPTNLPGSYSDIGVFSPSPYLTVTPASSTYYRLVVKCGTQADTTPGYQVVVSPGVSGVFLIDPLAPPGPNVFSSFNAAIASITCGVSGPVVFNVAPGIYNEQVKIPAIGGTSATNTITINGNGATLSFVSTNTNERGILKLDGADYIIVNNLNFTSTASSSSEYAYAIHMLNDADNNTINGCTINLSTATTSTTVGGIIISGTAISATAANSMCDNITLSNNIINGGYYGITMMGNGTTSRINNNQILNNTITDAYQYQIYLNGNNNMIIEGNNLSRPTRASATTFYGIYLTTGNLNSQIGKNRIHNPNGGGTNTAAYGIYLTASDGTLGNEITIHNNLIYNFTGDLDFYGFYNSSSDFVRYYYNIVSFENTSATASGTTKGFYQTSLATGIELKNNIFSLNRMSTGDQQMLFFNTSTTTYVSDNNNFYFGPASNLHVSLAYSSPNYYPNLNSWLTFSSKDASSFSVDPAFNSPATGDFTPNASVLKDAGTVVSITTDINNNPRTLPDIGAYEVALPPCNVPANSSTLLSASSVCQGQTVYLNLSGNNPGTGQTYQWQSSSDLLFSTPSNVGSSSSIPYSTIIAGSTLYYRAVVTCGTNIIYSTPQQLVVNTPVSGGTYTINSAVATGNGNFQTFADAVNFIACGVAGPVVFDVAAGSGPYNEQVTFPRTITGTSSVNRITINGNGAALNFNSLLTNKRYGILIDGVDYITINNLVINGTGSATTEYNIGIQLWDDADNNTINGCTINLNTTSTSTNFAGIVVNGSLSSPTGTGYGRCDSNMFTNNIIDGGYYALVNYGDPAAPNWNNQYSNNQLLNFYTYGIIANYNSAMQIVGNDISRPTRTGIGTFYGISLSTGNTGLKVNANRIHNPFTGAPTSTSTLYGIYNSNQASAASYNVFSNNLLYNLDGHGSHFYFYNYDGTYSKYYHNTVSSDVTTSTAGATYGAYFGWLDVSYNIEFSNNIITVSRGGTGTKYVMYIEDGTTGPGMFTSNNNLYYLNAASGTNNYGYYNYTAQPTFAAWKTASGQDAASPTPVSPVYANTAAGDFTPTASSLNNLGVPLGISTDILGNPRSIAQPDLGAYEFLTFPLQVKLLNFTASRNINDIILNWKVANEHNLESYGVERSLDGDVFSAIGSVEARRLNTYSFIDREGIRAATGTKLYYRLKMQEYNGSVEYSGTAVVSIGQQGETTVFYPNPFKDKIEIRTTTSKSSEALILITDLQGRIVKQELRKLLAGDNFIEISDLEKISNGIYQIELKTAENHFVQKLVK